MLHSYNGTRQLTLHHPTLHPRPSKFHHWFHPRFPRPLPSTLDNLLTWIRHVMSVKTFKNFNMVANNNIFDLKILVVLCCAACILVLITRIYWVLVRKQEFKQKKVEKLVKTLIVAGSGLQFIFCVYFIIFMYLLLLFSWFTLTEVSYIYSSTTRICTFNNSEILSLNSLKHNWWSTYIFFSCRWSHKRNSHTADRIYPVVIIQESMLLQTQTQWVQRR